MRQTNDKVFLDTNIIVYAHSDVEPEKQRTAQTIIAKMVTVISTQVLQETSNTLVKKFKHSWPDVSKVIIEVASNNMVHTNTAKTVFYACAMADKYHFSFYDSLIIASALECDCNILFSEDLQDGQVIENILKIVDPFNSKNQF
jgi:predicted nucleic acid-binding protein